MHNSGVRLVKHYLDDFVVLGVPGMSECEVGMNTLVSTCSRVSLPLVPGKCEGPSCRIVYLGIEIDTVNLCMGLSITLKASGKVCVYCAGVIIRQS